MTLSRRYPIRWLHYNAIADIFRSRTDRLDESLERIKKREREKPGHSSLRVVRSAKSRLRFKRLELCDMATDMANYFAQDNPHFDRDRFFKAANCWVGD
jgi:hypothetical protein